MANISAPRDNNRIPVLIGTSSVDGTSPVTVYVDPTTHRLKVDASSTSNLIIGTSTITGGTTTRILYDNAGVLGEYSVIPVALGGTNATSASITAFNNITGYTASGATGTTSTNLVFSTSPTLVTPVLGVATATSINKVTITAPATSAILTIADAKTVTHNSTTTFAGTDGKTLTINKTLTLDGTDSTTMTFPSTSATIARTDAGQTFTGVQNFTSPDVTTSITTASTSFTAFAGATTLLTIGGTGASASLFAPSTLDTTSSTTGAIRTSGGISAAKALNIGTNATIAGAIINTNNAITASGNAATVPVTASMNTVTNNSAATLTITLTTSGAVDRQKVIVNILDFSAVAQTITWVNTENSTVSAPTTSNGSTTLPLTVGFIYNNATSKWRCVGSA